MKNKTRNKKSLIALLLLLLFCAAYVAYDIADWGTPYITAPVPIGGFVLICIYLVLRQIGLKRNVCYAILTGIFAVTLFYIRTYAKETTTNDSQWIPITHLDFKYCRRPATAISILPQVIISMAAQPPISLREQ